MHDENTVLFISILTKHTAHFYTHYFNTTISLSSFVSAEIALLRSILH